MAMEGYPDCNWEICVQNHVIGVKLNAINISQLDSIAVNLIAIHWPVEMQSYDYNFCMSCVIPWPSGLTLTWL